MVSAATPLSLRISLTARCQLRCVYCMPTCRAEAPQDAGHLSVEEIVSFVRVAGEAFGLAKVHLTGGEPLLRDDILPLVRRLAKLPVGELVLTTNGQRLADLAGPLRQAGLGRVNVSLDSLDEGTYSAMTRGGDVKAALKGIAQARECGFRVKLNTVVLRGINGAEVIAIARWGLRHGCPVRFLELMPIGPAAGLFEERYVSSEQVQATLSQAFDLRPLPTQAGGTARWFLARDGLGLRGVLGFISANSRPFCQGCRRLRLTASGRLIGCLGLGLGPEIRWMLSSENDSDRRLLVEAVRTALDLKRVRDSFTTSKLMIQTGG